MREYQPAVLSIVRERERERERERKSGRDRERKRDLTQMRYNLNKNTKFIFEAIFVTIRLGDKLCVPF